MKFSLTDTHCPLLSSLPPLCLPAPHFLFQLPLSLSLINHRERAATPVFFLASLFGLVYPFMRYFSGVFSQRVSSVFQSLRPKTLFRAAHCSPLQNAEIQLDLTIQSVLLRLFSVIWIFKKKKERKEKHPSVQVHVYLFKNFKIHDLFYYGKIHITFAILTMLK